MDTKIINCFRGVYEEQSINQAAKRLYITPQGLSKIINHLEEELNTKLFIRTKKGMLPTPVGDYLYQKSLTLLNEFEQIQSNIQHIEQAQSIISIGFACGILNIFEEKDFSFLCQNECHWTEKNNYQIIHDLQLSKIDLAFIVGNFSHPDYICHPILSRNMTLIVQQNHPFYNKETVSIDELENIPLITLNENYSCYHYFVERCKDFHFTPHIIIKTMDSILLQKLCSMGIGLGIDVNLNHPNIYPNIHYIPLKDTQQWMVSIVYKKDIQQNQTKYQFINNLINTLKSNNN